MFMLQISDYKVLKCVLYLNNNRRKVHCSPLSPHFIGTRSSRVCTHNRSRCPARSREAAVPFKTRDNAINTLERSSCEHNSRTELYWTAKLTCSRHGKRQVHSPTEGTVTTSFMSHFCSSAQNSHWYSVACVARTSPQSDNSRT